MFLWLIGCNKAITIDLSAQGQTFRFLTPHLQNKNALVFHILSFIPIFIAIAQNSTTLNILNPVPRVPQLTPV